uniref:PB1 domain-containing protein n=1 Tax=Opuntia streptacantha TaxID=393608 RepID=A0A7C8ZTD5_OPUST
MSNSKPPLDNNKSNNTIKFLCGYGGKIVPRYPDGKLRYLGGHTRVLAVDRSISFPELLMKMGELCGTSVVVRCQLPTEDLDALVSIKSDEDLINIIEEYDLVSSSSAKIKAFLWPTKSKITPSPQPSEINATSPPMLSPRSLSPSPTYTSSSTSPMYFPVPVAVAAFPICYAKSSNGVDKFAPPQNQYGFHNFHNPSHVYLVHNGNHWQ